MEETLKGNMHLKLKMTWPRFEGKHVAGSLDWSLLLRDATPSDRYFHCYLWMIVFIPWNLHPQLWSLIEICFYLEMWFFSVEYDCQVSTTPPIAVTIFLNVKGELRTSNHQNILSPDKKSHSTELDAQIFMDLNPQSQKQSYLERQKFTYRWKFFFLKGFFWQR